MSGEISRDFARSLSRLHSEVDNLKKVNAQLIQRIDELEQRADKTDDSVVRKQKANVMRAIASQNPNVIEHTKATALDPTHQELLRLFTPQSNVTPTVVTVNQRLVDNMRAAFGARELPQLRVEVVEETVPYIFTDEYMKDTAKKLTLSADETRKKSQKLQELKDYQEYKERSNALGKLSPIWNL